MATTAVSQIYNIVNDVVSMALGDVGVTAVDTDSFVSLGNIINANPRSMDAFYSTLDDVIGRTVVAVRQYKAKNRSVKKEEYEFGAYLRKINYQMGKASENATWISEKQASPYDIESNTKITQTLFTGFGTYTYEDKLPTRQLKTAFKNAESMDSVIAGLYVAKDNYMELSLERLGAMAVNTYMAGVLNSTSTVCKRNLLKEYNDSTGSTLTVEQALTDLEALRFFSAEINLAVKNMSSFSKIFNVKKQERFTSKDEVVVEVNGKFANRSSFYLQSDTYHKELVALPHYEEISYWQGSGENFDFKTTSSINVTIDNNGEKVTISQTGIIAFVHDIDAVASSIYDRRNYTVFNPRSECVDVMDKADKGMIADLSENGIVFYLDDGTASASSLTLDSFDDLMEE